MSSELDLLLFGELNPVSPAPPAPLSLPARPTPPKGFVLLFTEPWSIAYKIPYRKVWTVDDLVKIIFNLPRLKVDKPPKIADIDDSPIKRSWIQHKFRDGIWELYDSGGHIIRLDDWEDLVEVGESYYLVINRKQHVTESKDTKETDTPDALDFNTEKETSVELLQHTDSPAARLTPIPESKAETPMQEPDKKHPRGHLQSPLMPTEPFSAPPTTTTFGNRLNPRSQPWVPNGQASSELWSFPQYPVTVPHVTRHSSVPQSNASFGSSNVDPMSQPLIPSILSPTTPSKDKVLPTGSNGVPVFQKELDSMELDSAENKSINNIHGKADNTDVPDTSRRVKQADSERLPDHTTSERLHTIEETITQRIARSRAKPDMNIYNSLPYNIVEEEEEEARPEPDDIVVDETAVEPEPKPDTLTEVPGRSTGLWETIPATTMEYDASGKDLDAEEQTALISPWQTVQPRPRQKTDAEDESTLEPGTSWQDQVPKRDPWTFAGSGWDPPRVKEQEQPSKLGDVNDATSAWVDSVNVADKENVVETINIVDNYDVSEPVNMTGEDNIIQDQPTSEGDNTTLNEILEEESLPKITTESPKPENNLKPVIHITAEEILRNGAQDLVEQVHEQGVASPPTSQGPETSPWAALSNPSPNAFLNGTKTNGIHNSSKSPPSGPRHTKHTSMDRLRHSLNNNPPPLPASDRATSVPIKFQIYLDADMPMPCPHPAPDNLPVCFRSYNSNTNLARVIENLQAERASKVKRSRNGKLPNIEWFRELTVVRDEDGTQWLHAGRLCQLRNPRDRTLNDIGFNGTRAREHVIMIANM